MPQLNFPQHCHCCEKPQTPYSQRFVSIIQHRFSQLLCYHGKRKTAAVHSLDRNPDSVTEEIKIKEIFKWD